MADLESLIRYRKHGLDEKRRALSELYRQSEDLQRQKEKLEEEIRHETELAEEMTSVESSAYLGRYLQASRKHVQKIEQAQRQLETKITIAQEDMRNAFAEMKKIEITQRRRDAREKAEEKRRETQELDEVALENYRRQQDEGED